MPHNRLGIDEDVSFNTATVNTHRKDASNLKSLN